MPEKSRNCNPFGDALVRGFLFGDTAPSSSSRDLQADPSPHFLGGYADHGAPAYKPVHHSHEEHPKGLGMAARFSPFLDPEFLVGANSFLPHGKGMKVQEHQQCGNTGYSGPFGLHHSFSAPSLEVPVIDDCSSWMNEVLEDMSAIHQDLSAVSAVPVHDFDDFIPSDFQTSIGTTLPDLRAIGVSDLKTSVVTSANITSTPSAPSAPTGPAPAPVSGPVSPVTPNALVLPAPPVALTPGGPASPTTPSTTRSQAVSSNTRSGAEEVMSGSPTPQALKARRSRAQKASEKRNIAIGERGEHVRRERKRRDDMSFKISTLESLLPVPGLMGNPKRDRATIVHDSVHHVKVLQAQVEELNKKLAELEYRKRSESILSRAIAREHANSKSPEVGIDGKGGKFVEYHIEIEGDTDEGGATLGKCRCRPDYMSRAMRVFEDLNLDVLRCTMTKMCLYTMCIIVAKPRATSSQGVSSSAVVEALRSSITVT